MGPYDEHEYPILTPSGDPGSADAKGIADPTVLYLADAEPPWHMWFDMLGSDDVWRIGHATSTDGTKWTKQTNEQGKTAVVLDIGEPGEWDDDFVHAPEVFVYDGEIRLSVTLNRRLNGALKAHVGGQMENQINVGSGFIDRLFVAAISATLG